MNIIYHLFTTIIVIYSTFGDDSFTDPNTYSTTSRVLPTDYIGTIQLNNIMYFSFTIELNGICIKGSSGTTNFFAVGIYTPHDTNVGVSKAPTFSYPYCSTEPRTQISQYDNFLCWIRRRSDNGINTIDNVRIQIPTPFQCDGKWHFSGRITETEFEITAKRIGAPVYLGQGVVNPGPEPFNGVYSASTTFSSSRWVNQRQFEANVWISSPWFGRYGPGQNFQGMQYISNLVTISNISIVTQATIQTTTNYPTQPTQLTTGSLTHAPIAFAEMYWITDGAPGGNTEWNDECLTKTDRQNYGSVATAVRCCDDNTPVNGFSPDCNAINKDFSQAFALCQSSGYRLCTRQELKAGVARGSGCGFDGYSVWTSDSCTAHTSSPTNQPTHSPTNQPTHSPTNQPTHSPINFKKCKKELCRKVCRKKFNEKCFNCVARKCFLINPDI